MLEFARSPNRGTSRVTERGEHDRVIRAHVTSPRLVVDTVEWDDGRRHVVTVLVHVTYQLRALDLAQWIGAVVPPFEEPPWQGAADVIVTASPPRDPRSAAPRRVAVARGCEVVWGQTIGASVDWTQPVELTREVPMPFLRGGEQLLLTGFSGGDMMTRLPAEIPTLSIHKPGGAETVGLLGDRLCIDADRMIATLTWRGHLRLTRQATRTATLQVSLAPLIEVEEVLGSPPAWLRSRWRPPSAVPTIVGNSKLSAATISRNATQLSLVVKATFDLASQEPASLCADQAPLSGDQFVDGDLGQSLVYPSDFVPLKPRVDILVAGFIYARPGATTAVARLVLGEVDKSIAAIGPRQWGGDVPSEPKPFERIPIRYEEAFGGADNPLGCDLPRLEQPHDVIRTRASRPAAACFAPLSPSWRRGGGTYDEAWRTHGWPHDPADFDVRAFNAAPVDQQCAALAGDEAYAITSVLPSGAALEGRLPGRRPWAFALRLDGSVERMQLNLDTLWFDVEARRLVMVWRGPTSRDTQRIWLTFGRLGEEPQLSEARGALLDAFDERFSAETVAARRTKAQVVILLGDAVRSRKKWEAAVPRPRPVKRERVASWLAASESLAGRDLSGADLSDFDLSGQALDGAILKGARLSGARLDGASCRGAMLAEARAANSSWRGADLSRADLTGAMLPSACLAGASLRHASLARARLENADLQGAALVQADLVDADLSGADLESADLTRADLSSAVLDDSVLAKATLKGAKLYAARGAGVRLEGASLQGARLERAQLPGLHANDIEAAESMWESANLSGAQFRRAVLTGASFVDAAADQAVLDGADLRGARLRGASLRGAIMRGADMMQADLGGADLTRADIRRANLYQAETHGARLHRTRLDGTQVAGTRLPPDAGGGAPR